MASVSNSSSTSSNIYSALGAKNKGIGGLATGLDTDSLVEALTSGTRSKIAKQGQAKQLLNWKMTAYRGLTTALRAFQTKSFSYSSTSSTSNTNIMSSAFFNTFKATSSSSKVSVSAGTNALTGAFTITQVKQLAEAESLKSTTPFSKDLILGVQEGKVMEAGAFTGETLKLAYNDTVKTIKLDTLNDAIRGDGTLDMTKFEKELQSLLDKAFAKKSVYNETLGDYEDISNVKVSVTADGVKLDSDSAKITVAYDNTLLKVYEGNSNRVDLNKKISSLEAFKDLQGDVLKFSINGTEISVSKNDSLSAIMAKVNSSDAGVRMTYSAFTNEFTLTSKTTGGGENIVVRDVQGNLMNTIFGAQSGNGLGTGYLTTAAIPTSQNANTVSTLGAGSAAMKDLGSKLAGMEFQMTINGVTKTVKLDMSKINTSDNPNAVKDGTFTINDIYNAMNKGIETAFGTTDVKFYGNPDGTTSIYATPGTAASLNSGGLNRGGIMDVLGFTGPAGNAVLNLDYEHAINGTSSIAGLNVASGTTATLEMTINGVTKQLQITSGINASNYKSKLEKAVKDAFGSDISEKLKFSADSDGLLKLDISDPNMLVSIGHGSTTNGKVDLYGMLGFGGASVDNTKAGNNGTTFGDLAKGQSLTAGKLTISDGDNEIEVEYDSAMTLQDFINKINTESGGAISAGIKNGQLSLVTKSGYINVTDDGSIMKDIFGVSGGVFETKDQEYAEGAHKAGKNAEIIMNGAVLSEASNTFTINGVSVTVNEKSDTAITIDVKSDPDDVVSRIKSWMDDYNALIFTLNSSINESKNGDYTPLTDEQRAQMTEDQIKTWETEAKKGILRSDSTIKDILAQLRQSLYEKVEAAGISLYDIGIVTKGYSDPNESGQIEFDKNVSGGGEAKLRAMLENNPDKVRLLFTDPDYGIAVKMNSTINKAANPSSVDRGTLVRIAGTEQLTGDNTSTLGNKISAIDKFIATLTARLEAEYTRQWKKFSALEVAVQRMSSQSSWLNQS